MILYPDEHILKLINRIQPESNQENEDHCINTFRTNKPTDEPERSQWDGQIFPCFHMENYIRQPMKKQGLAHKYKTYTAIVGREKKSPYNIPHVCMDRESEGLTNGSTEVQTKLD